MEKVDEHSFHWEGVKNRRLLGRHRDEFSHYSREQLRKMWNAASSCISRPHEKQIKFFGTKK